ncbi:hypothetical protein BKA62DRAFT_713888 [Auriculariales sp. MPI-PUGE-AT-0066]|nr:hypothetical protein BKA62DRAFT_713888 [Auriculariales sp. MPI-PUGE-AT-0066]
MDGANPVMAKRSPSPLENANNKKSKVASKDQPAKAPSGRRKGNNGGKHMTQATPPQSALTPVVPAISNHTKAKSTRNAFTNITNAPTAASTSRASSTSNSHSLASLHPPASSLPSLFLAEAQEDLSQDSDESDGSDDEDTYDSSPWFSFPPRTTGTFASSAKGVKNTPGRMGEQFETDCNAMSLHRWLVEAYQSTGFALKQDEVSYITSSIMHGTNIVQADRVQQGREIATEAERLFKVAMREVRPHDGLSHLVDDVSFPLEDGASLNQGTLMVLNYPPKSFKGGWTANPVWTTEGLMERGLDEREKLVVIATLKAAEKKARADFKSRVLHLKQRKSLLYLLSWKLTK